MKRDAVFVVEIVALDEILRTEDGGDTWAAADVELTGTIDGVEDLDGGEAAY